MRLPYVPTIPPESAESDSESAYKELAARRQPAALQALDLTLLHSPPIASGWSSFFGAIRTGGILPIEIRELCICRVAVLNEAVYEWEQHLPLLLGCEAGKRMGPRGIRELKDRSRSSNIETRNGGHIKPEVVDDGGLYYTDDEGRICFLPDEDTGSDPLVGPAPTANSQSHQEEEGEGLSEQQWAVMAYTDAMTKDVKVTEVVSKELQNWFQEREIVEITATVAAYNCVSRFLVALDVGERNHATIDGLCT
ncbi:MAG: hypothetical protein Q9219_004097 [cf. Caloplaca sp. 3 TL-2023]